MNILKLNTSRDTYDKVDAARNSITVEELIDILSQYPEKAKVVFSNDGGYTYGFVEECSISFSKNVSNLTSQEESEIENAVDKAVSTFILADKLADGCDSTDILNIIDEVCDSASIIEEEKKEYAKKYVSSTY